MMMLLLLAVKMVKIVRICIDEFITN